MWPCNRLGFRGWLMKFSVNSMQNPCNTVTSWTHLLPDITHTLCCTNVYIVRHFSPGLPLIATIRPDGGRTLLRIFWSSCWFCVKITHSWRARLVCYSSSSQRWAGLKYSVVGGLPRRNPDSHVPSRTFTEWARTAKKRVNHTRGQVSSLSRHFMEYIPKLN